MNMTINEQTDHSGSGDKIRAAFFDTETRNQIYASYRAGLRSVRDRDACPKYEKTPAEVREEYQVLFDTIMKTSK